MRTTVQRTTAPSKSRTSADMRGVKSSGGLLVIRLLLAGRGASHECTGRAPQARILAMKEAGSKLSAVRCRARRRLFTSGSRFVRSCGVVSVCCLRPCPRTTASSAVLHDCPISARSWCPRPPPPAINDGTSVDGDATCSCRRHSPWRASATPHAVLRFYSLPRSAVSSPLRTHSSAEAAGGVGEGDAVSPAAPMPPPTSPLRRRSARATPRAGEADLRSLLFIHLLRGMAAIWAWPASPHNTHPPHPTPACAVRRFFFSLVLSCRWPRAAPPSHTSQHVRARCAPSAAADIPPWLARS